MDAIDFDTLDAGIDTERTQLAEALRRIADRLDTLGGDVIGPLTMVGDLVLRLPGV